MARLTFHSAGKAHGASGLGTGTGINQRLYDVGECGPGGLRTARCNTYLSGRQFLLVHLFLALEVCGAGALSYPSRDPQGFHEASHTDTAHAVFVGLHSGLEDSHQMTLGDRDGGSHVPGNV